MADLMKPKPKWQQFSHFELRELAESASSTKQFLSDLGYTTTRMPTSLRKELSRLGVKPGKKRSYIRSRQSSLHFDRHEPPSHFEKGFRQINGNPLRDLSPARHQELNRELYFLYLSSPIVFRGINISSDFTIGESITFEADDPNVNELLEEHWARNNWDEHQFTLAREIALFGEQFFELSVAFDGVTLVGYIDPLLVSRVVADKSAEPKEIVIGFNNPGDPQSQNQHIDVARHGQPGAIIFQINKSRSATRGNSDLTSAVDWAIAHNDFLITIHEAAGIKTSSVLDITAQGASDAELTALERDYQRAFAERGQAGVIRAHPEGINVQHITPNLSTDELAEHAMLLKRHVATALGIPPHWLAESQDVNRSTAEAQSFPAISKLRSRQREIRCFFGKLFRHQIKAAKLHGRLDKNASEKFNINLPQIAASDTASTAGAMLSAAQGLSQGVEHGYVSIEEAAQAFKYVVRQLGLGILDSPIKQPNELNDPEDIK